MVFNSQLNTSGREPTTCDTPVSLSIDIPTESLYRLGRDWVKKIGLDVNDLSNYLPVTNLTHLFKIIERTKLDQLVPFLEEVGVVPRYQSAYRKLHSTETTLCKMHDDLVSNTCHGKASILVLLDLSAAFDTVDH